MKTMSCLKNHTKDKHKIKLSPIYFIMIITKQRKIITKFKGSLMTKQLNQEHKKGKKNRSLKIKSKKNQCLKQIKQEAHQDKEEEKAEVCSQTHRKNHIFEETHCSKQSKNQNPCCIFSHKTQKEKEKQPF